MLIPGSPLGPYEIVSALGAGGMGEVYRARDTKLNRDVAIKVLLPAIANDPDRLARFSREARVLASLNHPNIAQIFEIGESGGRAFIVMELVEGEPLSVRIQRGSLEWTAVVDVALQLFDALDEAHAHGVVHRDLKPANLVMTLRGRVKILDFGLAKMVGADESLGATQLETNPGVIMGTVHYMSPEQALGRDMDTRTDIFSAGTVLYQLVTGRLPFDGASATDTIDHIVHAQPDSIARLNYGAPLELERIIKKTLEKDAARRYQTARDALIDLNNLKRDRDSSVQAQPVARAKRGSTKVIDSLAVLPLATATADEEIDYLADGITESLIDALSQLPKLKVMARSTVFRYKGRQVDAQTVGRELGVRAALLGRLQRIGDRIVMRGELVDASDGSHLWGGQFQRDAADVLALQEDLAQEVADQLRLRLTRDDRKRLQKRHTQNVRAYEAYMRGRFQLAKRTNEGFAKAIECFNAAIAEDHGYALAYSGLADCYTLMGTGAYVASPDEAIARARQAAEKAIVLDDQLAEAHSALGFVRFRIDWDWPAAEASLTRACDINPGNASAHHRYALLLTASGRHDEALAEIRRAYELDPQSLIIGTAYGRILHFSRRYDEAVVQLRHTLEVDGQFRQAHFDLGMSFAQLGRFADAKGELEPLLETADRRSLMLAVLGNVYASAGDTARALEVASEIRERHAQGRATIADLGYVLAGLGEIEEAITCFERAADARAGLIVYLKVEPMVDPLRAHPRFISLMRRIKLG